MSVSYTHRVAAIEKFCAQHELTIHHSLLILYYVAEKNVEGKVDSIESISYSLVFTHEYLVLFAGLSLA